MTGEFTLYATYDSYVTNDAPNTNYGSAEVLRYGLSLAGKDYHTFFKFNLSEAHETYGDLNMTAARLYVYHSSIGRSGNSIIQSINPAYESWEEDTITWSNMPDRYAYAEAGAVLVEYSEKYYYYPLFPESYLGNSTRGLPALQLAYDSYGNKTYIQGRDPDFDTYAYVSSRETAYNLQKPKLVIEYEISGTPPEEGADPFIPNPVLFTLRYYPIADAMVNSYAPTVNAGTENVSAIDFDIGSGITHSAFLKFNFSYPDLIDGNVNTEKTILQPLFDAISIRFGHYADWVPEGLSPPFYIDWRGFYGVSGINRDDENWTETGVTWNTQPLSSSVVDRRWVEKAGWSFYNLADLEYAIRASVENETTFTISHRVDTSLESDAWGMWRMREYGGTSQPFIEMRVAVSYDMGVTFEDLRFQNAHHYFARVLNVPSFIGGILLSLVIFMVTVVPLSYITKNRTFSLFLVMGSLLLYTMFGWLPIQVFIFLFLFSVVTVGAKLKGWI